jgi:hypothetical protein
MPQQKMVVGTVSSIQFQGFGPASGQMIFTIKDATGTDTSLNLAGKDANGQPIYNTESIVVLSTMIISAFYFGTTLEVAYQVAAPNVGEPYSIRAANLTAIQDFKP